MSLDIGSYPSSGCPDPSPTFDADDAAAYVDEPSPMDTYGCCDGGLQSVMSSLFADSQPGGATDASYTIQGTYMMQPRDSKAAADFGGFGRELSSSSRQLPGNLDKFCAAADVSAHFAAQAQYSHYDDSSAACLKPPTTVAPPPSTPYAEQEYAAIQHHKQQAQFSPHHHQSGFHQHPGLPGYRQEQKDVVAISSSGNCSSSSSSSNNTICYQGNNQTVFSSGYQQAAYQADFYAADNSRMHNFNFPSPDHHHGGSYRGDINIHITGQHYASPALSLNLGSHINAG